MAKSLIKPPASAIQKGSAFNQRADRVSGKLFSARSKSWSWFLPFPIGLSWLTVFLALPALAQTPALLTDLGSVAPTPGLFDVAQLLTTGQANKPDGLNYYTDNQSNHSAGEPGQTFTTPFGASGFVLASLALKTGGGTTAGTATAQNYLLHIYSVNGSTNTLLTTYIATNFVFTDGDWLQWRGLNTPMTVNSVYAFSFGKASSAVAGWEAMGNAAGNPYSGGELGLFPV